MARDQLPGLFHKCCVLCCLSFGSEDFFANFILADRSGSSPFSGWCISTLTRRPRCLVLRSPAGRSLPTTRSPARRRAMIWARIPGSRRCRPGTAAATSLFRERSLHLRQALRLGQGSPLLSPAPSLATGLPLSRPGSMVSGLISLRSIIRRSAVPDR